MPPDAGGAGEARGGVYVSIASRCAEVDKRAKHSKQPAENEATADGRVSPQVF